MTRRGKGRKASGHACPICGQPAAVGEESFPFCSLHCKSVDLYNWLSGSYQVPGLDTDEYEDEGEGGTSGDTILFD